MSTFRFLFLGLLCVLGFARDASAQAPKLGDWYENTTTLGFKIKTPKSWVFIPPQPGEETLIGGYAPENTKYITLGGSDILWLDFKLMKFDRRKAKKAAAEEEEEEDNVIVIGARGKGRPTNFLDWMESAESGFKQEESKERKLSKVPVTEYEFVKKSSEGNEIRAFAAVFHLTPELDVVLFGNGPGKKKSWAKYSKAYTSMMKSFKRLELEEVDTGGYEIVYDSPMRSAKRAKLQQEVASQPGWALYETENYFIISNNDDREFLKELMGRLEAIRAVYEVDYPIEEAQRIRELKAKQEAEKKREEGEEVPPGERRTTSSGPDSVEQSRASVVRVCASRGQYHEYGGPGGSAGYWASFHEELVIYDDKAGGGRDSTWSVLNHEAFHQYIYYFYENLAPHSWYNEGTGDFYAGYEYKHKRFNLTPFDWRVQTIKGAIKDNKHIPLKELVRFTQAQYYGQNKYGVGGGQNYAQGWSFIYFLRTGGKQAKNWNPGWDNLLSTYLTTLAETSDLDMAVDTAFADVNFDELEACWLEYTK